MAAGNRLATACLPGWSSPLRREPGRLGSPASRGVGGQLGEIGGSPAVYFGDQVGVVAQGGSSAAAVAEAGGSVAQVDPAGQQLAGGVVAQGLDVEADPGAFGHLGHLVCHPVRVPGREAERIAGENIGGGREFDMSGVQERLDLLLALGENGGSDRVDGEIAVLVSL